MSQLKGLHYQIWRHKKQILDLDATQKKKKGAAYFELPEDLDQEWIEEHQKALIEEQRTKIEKKFEKDNEKRKADKEKPLGNSELKERLKVLKEMETMYKKENKTNKVEAGPRDTVEGLHKKIEALEKRIENHKAQMEDREGNKEVALGTSKIVSPSMISCLVHIHTDKKDRTTSIRASQLCSPRNSMCRLRSSFRKPCETSSAGLSRPSRTRTTGLSKLLGSCLCRNTWLSIIALRFTIYMRYTRKRFTSGCCVEA